MMIVAENNLIPLIIALLIGILTGWWMYRRRRPDRRTSTLDRTTPAGRVEREVAPPPPPTRSHARGSGPAHEGQGIHDHAASAATDVAGEVLGVRAHAELPGAAGPPDNLQMLKGVGPRMATLLNQQGISRFDQLATLDRSEIDMLDEHMGPFRGRLLRDRIVEQAAFLARGDRDGFEASFGKLGEA